MIPRKTYIASDPGGGREGATVVIIQAAHDQEKCDHNFWRCLRTAVAEWIGKTEDGRTMWEDSCRALNLQDFAVGESIVPPPVSLVPFLEAVGISAVTIQLFYSDDSARGPDDYLVSEDEVEEARQ